MVDNMPMCLNDNLLTFILVATTFMVQACNKEKGTAISQPSPSTSTALRHSWPIDLRHAEIMKDDKLVLKRSEYWSQLDTPIEEVRKSLSEFVAVDKDTWLHQYHHVSGGDQAGWIILPNGERIKWMLRPGGLAYVEYADGTQVYLAKRK